MPRKITKDDCRQPKEPRVDDVLNGASRHAGIDHALSITVRPSVTASAKIRLRWHFVFLQDVLHPRSEGYAMRGLRIAFSVSIKALIEHIRPAKIRPIMQQSWQHDGATGKSLLCLEVCAANMR